MKNYYNNIACLLGIRRWGFYICLCLHSATTTQCYFCDTDYSAQGDVTDPQNCVTFTACDFDQVRTSEYVSLLYSVTLVCVSTFCWGFCKTLFYSNLYIVIGIINVQCTLHEQCSEIKILWHSNNVYDYSSP